MILITAIGSTSSIVAIPSTIQTLPITSISTTSTFSPVTIYAVNVTLTTILTRSNMGIGQVIVTPISSISALTAISQNFQILAISQITSVTSLNAIEPTAIQILSVLEIASSSSLVGAGGVSPLIQIISTLPIITYSTMYDPGYDLLVPLFEPSTQSSSGSTIGVLLSAVSSTTSSSVIALIDILNACSPSTTSSSTAFIERLVYLGLHTLSTVSSIPSLLLEDKISSGVSSTVSSSIASLTYILAVTPPLEIQLGTASLGLLQPLSVVPPNPLISYGTAALNIPYNPLLSNIFLRGTSLLIANPSTQLRVVQIKGVYVNSGGTALPDIDISVQLNSFNNASSLGQLSGNIGFTNFTNFTTDGSGNYILYLTAPQDIGSGFTYTITFDPEGNPFVVTTTSFAYSSSIYLGLADIVSANPVSGVAVKGYIFSHMGSPLLGQYVIAQLLGSYTYNNTNEFLSVANVYSTSTLSDGSYMLYLPPNTQLTPANSSYQIIEGYGSKPRTIVVGATGGYTNSLVATDYSSVYKALPFTSVGNDVIEASTLNSLSALSSVSDTLSRIRYVIDSLAGEPNWATTLGTSETLLQLNNPYTGNISLPALSSEYIDACALESSITTTANAVGYPFYLITNTSTPLQLGVQISSMPLPLQSAVSSAIITQTNLPLPLTITSTGGIVGISSFYTDTYGIVKFSMNNGVNITSFIGGVIFYYSGLFYNSLVNIIFTNTYDTSYTISVVISANDLLTAHYFQLFGIYATLITTPQGIGGFTLNASNIVIGNPSITYVFNISYTVEGI